MIVKRCTVFFNLSFSPYLKCHCHMNLFPSVSLTHFQPVKHSDKLALTATANLPNGSEVRQKHFEYLFWFNMIKVLNTPTRWADFWNAYNILGNLIWAEVIYVLIVYISFVWTGWWSCLFSICMFLSLSQHNISLYAKPCMVNSLIFLGIAHLLYFLLPQKEQLFTVSWHTCQ